MTCSRPYLRSISRKILSSLSIFSVRACCGLNVLASGRTALVPNTLCAVPGQTNKIDRLQYVLWGKRVPVSCETPLRTEIFKCRAPNPRHYGDRKEVTSCGNDSQTSLHQGGPAIQHPQYPVIQPRACTFPAGNQLRGRDVMKRALGASPTQPVNLYNIRALFL